MKESTCEWTQESPEYDWYNTECGGMWEFTEGGPKDNQMKFCCYCGKSLSENKPTGRK